MKRSSQGIRLHLLFLVVVLVALRSTAGAPRGEEEEEDSEVADDIPPDAISTTAATEQAPPQATTTVVPEDFKTASTTQETTTTPPAPTRTAPLYRLTSAKDETCILLEVDGLLVFKYRTTVEEERETDKFIPEDVNISGTCGDDSATLNLGWSTYKLMWSFFKTPGGEKWYVDRIELTFNTSERIFEHTKIPGWVFCVDAACLLGASTGAAADWGLTYVSKSNSSRSGLRKLSGRKLTLSTPKNHRVLLFPTPVGKSFTCSKETPVELGDHDQIKATLLLREFHLQPFIFKGNDFGPEHECSARGIGALIDETAPIAVGSTLAIVVLLTVTGYGIYRYFKVKKVQYDTME